MMRQRKATSTICVITTTTAARNQTGSMFESCKTSVVRSTELKTR